MSLGYWVIGLVVIGLLGYWVSSHWLIGLLYKRSDVLVYDSNAEPLLLIECKAPEVKITQEVFDQASRYNSVYKVRFILVTNGLQHYCAEIDHNSSSHKFLDDIPSFDLITTKHDA